MMICDADFEELFPALFPALQAPAAAPSPECIARWEDDGGLPLHPAPPRYSAPRRAAAFGYDMAGFARAGAIAAAVPAIATYAAASTMFSAYDEMTSGRNLTF